MLYSAWGVVGGTVLGLITALVQRMVNPNLHEWAQFGLMTGVFSGYFSFAAR